MQVSRTKTCLISAVVRARRLLMSRVAGVTARNATNLPEALMDGSRLVVPVSKPFESVETICVVGEQLPSLPAQVSRK